MAAVAHPHALLPMSAVPSHFGPALHLAGLGIPGRSGWYKRLRLILIVRDPVERAWSDCKASPLALFTHMHTDSPSSPHMRARKRSHHPPELQPLSARSIRTLRLRRLARLPAHAASARPVDVYFLHMHSPTSVPRPGKIGTLWVRRRRRLVIPREAREAWPGAADDVGHDAG